ncbi:SDR family NAD(P)-dependent oxidoreductase [Enhygromyxa salina]|uniref:Phenolphthiocerol synthesis polyketide synthase type I Pks15/1 n=1 Tax=Enhygromyxa salina TaxID=215803 RepID=A0A2S9YN24_9BACT|nr:SDR family NAD(P)-dependent oxidoreductase [Enhygromyxa salina]PRQ06479.1 Phenolphthiocerol synthesis polyketide synthase type I Pks15/1 [Enhygromyxa salina]
MSEVEYAELMRRAMRRIAETEAELARLRAAPRQVGEPLAIVSMACRLPGADNPEQLWRLLEAGHSPVREVPATRWNVERWYDEDPERVGRSYSRWGCFLDDVTGFDAGLFGISRREAQWMDPQQRILLEVVWEALERGGHSPRSTQPREFGVFVGASSFDYMRLATAARERVDAHTGSGVAPSALAGRVAFCFGLSGPTLTIDSACSSSLVAVHLACQALRSGECEAAIAAGTSLMLAPDMSLIEARTRMLAPDGKCKSFDARADGVVRGEGVGVVLLRRLSDALRDGDPIVAIIRGSAVNQNGHGGSLTTPHAGAQRELLRRACANAGVDGAELDVVEAHGTGTAVGDPIEAEALSAALCVGRGPDQPLWIGTLKPNLGHLEATAGIAGLIKLALMIERGTLLPTANLDQPNPKIDWRGDKLAISTTARAWPERPDGARLGGVSAFGFAGTNCHVIVGRAARAQAQAQAQQAQTGLLTLSAQTPTALVGLAQRWRDRLAVGHDHEVADLCWTAAVGRAQLRERLAVVGDRRQLIAALDSFVAGLGSPSVHRDQAREPATCGWLVAELDATSGGSDAALTTDEPAAVRLLAVLERADTVLTASDPAARIRFVRRVARLVELRPNLICLDEIVGVGSSAALAAWLAGALELDVAARLSWLWTLHRRAAPAERDPIERMYEAELDRLVWVAPTCGLVDTRGARIHDSYDARRALTLAPVSDRDPGVAEAQAALEAAGATSILSLVGGAADPGRDSLVQLAIDLDRDLDTRALLELDAAAWVRGHARRLGPPARRVQAPVYPFEHAPAWLPHLRPGEHPETEAQTFAGQRPEHPLLGRAIELVGGEPKRRFEARISSESPAWLGDHRVFGEVVFPGAGWIEIALAAGRELFGRDAIELEEVEFLRPLTLASGRGVALQTVLEAEDGPHGWRIEIHARALDGADATAEWTLHASARVRPLEHARGPAEPRPATLVATPDQVPGQPGALEARALELGVSFGPDFCVLEAHGSNAPAGPDQHGAIVLHEHLAARDHTMLAHPIVVDACLRVIGAEPEFAEGRDPWLPARVARVRCWRRTPARSWCRARSEQLDARRRSATARCFTEAGEPCFELDGLELTRHRPQRDALGSAASWIYKLDWRRLGALGPACSPAIDVSQLTAAAAAEPVPPELLARIQDYASGLDELELLAGDCVSAGLGSLGGLDHGATVDVAQLRARWGVGEAFDGALTRMLDILVERGELARVGANGRSRWQVTRSGPHAEFEPPDQLRARLSELADRRQALTHEVDTLTRCGTRLPAILRGQADPLELLMGADARAVERLYRAPMIELKNRRIAGVVRALIDARESDPGLRLLEVGAGTGETAAAIFTMYDAIGREPAEYCLTDVSPAFLDRARERFAGRRWLRTERLDLDDPPPLGAASLGRFDVIVASNVLHVTRDLRRSLAHLRRLLAPGGVLVIMEGAAALRWVDLSFGLTAGWWRFGDRDLRPDYPLLPAPAWQRLLEAQGFASVSCLAPARPELAILAQQSVIVAQVDGAAATADPRARWLIVGGGQLGAALSARLREIGEAAVQLVESNGGVAPSVAPSVAELRGGPHSLTGRRVDVCDRAALAELWRELAAADAAPTHVVHLWRLDGSKIDAHTTGAELRARGEAQARSALALVQATLDALADHPPTLWFLTRGAVAISEGHPRVDGLAGAPLWGLGRVVDSEHPELACRRLDLDDDASPAEIVELLRASPVEDELALREGARWAPRLNPAELRASEGPSFDPTGGYVITGGLGGVGLATAQWLVTHGARRLALLGRRPPSASARASVAALAREGVTVVVAEVDVSDETALTHTLSSVRAELGPLRGVFHSAGVIADGTVHKLDWDRFAQVLAPKVEGAWNLHRATAGDPLDHFVLYSSAVALLRAWGQANHCAANSFLPALAAHRRARGLPATVVDWGAWADVGAADRPEAGARMHALGMGTMPAAQALDAMAAVLGASLGHAAIMPIDWRRFTGRLRATPLLRELAELDDLGSPGLLGMGRAGETSRLLTQLRESSPPDRPELLLGHLRERVAKLMGLRRPETLDAGQPLFELGLDSLMAIELKNGLGRDLGLRLRSTLLFDFPTVASLAEHLLAELDARLDHRDQLRAPRPAAPAPAREPARDDTLAEEIRGLDELALGALIDAEFETFAGELP